MKPDRLARRWDRRQACLLAEVRRLLTRCRRFGGAEEVHALRVALRRMRLLVRVGKGLYDDVLTARLRVWGQRISDATGPLRDLDVAVEWLRASQAGTSLVEETLRLRDHAWRRRRRFLSAPPLAVVRRLSTTRARSRAGVLERRFRKLESRYRGHVRERLPGFFALGEEERHEFRRTVRWWRYLRELAVPQRRLRKDRRHDRLLAAQEALGEIQNLTLVQAALPRLTASPEREELRALLSRQQQVQLQVARHALGSLQKVLG